MDATGKHLTHSLPVVEITWGRYLFHLLALPLFLGGHSLRAGFATAAAQDGATERSILAQTGHKSLPMLRRYIRLGSLFSDNAAAAIKL